MSEPIGVSIRTENSTHVPIREALTVLESHLGFQVQNPGVGLAPHYLRLMECGTIAVDRNCAVVGICQNTPPTSSASHTILGMENHPTFQTTLQTIRDFLTTLELKKTFTFKIQNCLAPIGKVSICSILVAIWKFISIFHEEGDQPIDTAEAFQARLALFFEAKNIKVTQSEIRAVLKGGESAYINYFLKDVFDIIQYGKETAVSAQTVIPFFREFDLIFLRTDSSNMEESSDYYFKPSFVNDFKKGFDELDYDELDNMDIDDSDSDSDPSESSRNEFRVIYNVLSRISKARIERPQFSASTVEKEFQQVLEKLIGERLEEQIVRGGYASNEGLLLIVDKHVFDDRDFHKLLANAFLQCKIHPSFITLEKLQAGKAAISSNHIERENGPITTVNIIPNFCAEPSSPPPILHKSCHKTIEQRCFIFDDSVEMPEYESFATV
ncbi:unnamed protein product [Caenorhabditis angaria]|uniref:Switch protein XOL-1 N-terminal domain-containing protein n=1 Tax=Caenorhabditis angaria TaxID=860376 RepID=A0A9P1N7G3_9PELO|nr:unnamed protein product [Caenorhabditis angaria]